MKAWQITAAGEPIDVLRLGNRPEPPLPAGHLRCVVHASAIGWPDTAMCRGTYAFRPPLPFTPGQEFCGRVVEIAPDAIDAGIGLGDRVAGVSSFFTGEGAFADTTIARPDTLYPVPQAMTDVQAAAFCIPFHTAQAALVLRAQLRAGETLLVHGGSGGTGSAAIQLGDALGAIVIATAGGKSKAAVCRDLGATHVIDHTAEPFADAVLSHTHGAGADVVFDPVGGDVFEESFRCLARFGRILPVGLASGRWGAVPIGSLALRNVSIMTASPSGYPRAEALAHHADLVERFGRGELTPLVGATVDFTEIADAVQAVADRSSIGRTVARRSTVDDG